MKLDSSNIKYVPIRQGFGEGLLEAGEKNLAVVALCADVTDSNKITLFKEKFPERFFEMGITEQNMSGVASGMSKMGKIPFMTSYAMFNPGRNWEQIRTTICYNDVNVKIVGGHAGLSAGSDGGTHQAVEDIALMRVLPRVTVVVPCDAIEAKKATVAIANRSGVTYIRLGREKTAVITDETTPFEIGRAYTIFDSGIKEGAKKVGIIACGTLVYHAILAAQKLQEEGYEVAVLNLHTIKPLDGEAVLSFAKRFGKIVTAEEHQVAGGMGSAVAEFLAQNNPVLIRFIGIQDKYGQSGTQDELFKHYKLTADDILKTAKGL
jgi:transketolase